MIIIGQSSAWKFRRAVVMFYDTQSGLDRLAGPRKTLSATEPPKITPGIRTTYKYKVVSPFALGPLPSFYTFARNTRIYTSIDPHITVHCRLHASPLFIHHTHLKPFRMPPKAAAEKKPTATAGKAPAGKAPAEKKEAGKKTPVAAGDKKKRTKTRKETYSSYIYKGSSITPQSCLELDLDRAPFLSFLPDLGFTSSS